VPKHAWTGGTVGLAANGEHGIKSSKGIHFRTIAEIGPAIEKLLSKSGIKLRPDKSAKLYFVER
jgi:hypothetical protein